MKQLRFGYVIVLTVVFALVVSCSINESDVDPLGALSVTAMDTSQAIPLQGGQVLINNVPRAQDIPAVIGGLRAGEVSVTYRPGQLYPSQTVTATVSPPETTEVVFLYSQADAFAEITITTPGNIGTIVVDEELRPDLALGEPFQLAPGTYTFSVFEPGFTTESPALRTLTLEGDQSETEDFALQEMATGAQVGDLFPNFTLPNDWEGENSLAQYRGHVVLVNFWFFNCQPCREEFPYIEQTWQERAGEGFRVLGVNVGWYNDGQDEFEQIRELIQPPLTFPLLFNTLGNDWTFDTLQLMAAPTSFIVDPRGEIMFRVDAGITYEQLNQMIDAAMDTGGGQAL